MDWSSRTIPQIRKLLAKQPAVAEELIRRLAEDPRAGVRALAARQQKRRLSEARERERISSLLSIERRLWSSGFGLIAGVDEAGRGPLAGPVVAAAVILPRPCVLPGLNDSKKLSPKRREVLFDDIQQQALAVGVGTVSHSEIDRVNILEGAMEAMRRAVDALPLRPDCVLVDGSRLPRCGVSERAVVDGDARCLSIAAASIVAKVTRDRHMKEMDVHYPGYGFAQHKGYGTREHIAALRELGPCAIHRRSFRQVEEHGHDGSEDFAVFQRGIRQARTRKALEGIGRAIKACGDGLARDEVAKLRQLYRGRLAELSSIRRASAKGKGSKGEDAAATHLNGEGFVIVERNYHWARGEIDLVARRQDLLVFVEVKAGKTGDFGPPETWVDQRKQRRIVEGAQAYLQEHQVSGVDLRFDVVAIDLQSGTLKHIEDAFRVEE